MLKKVKQLRIVHTNKLQKFHSVNYFCIFFRFVFTLDQVVTSTSSFNVFRHLNLEKQIIDAKICMHTFAAVNYIFVPRTFLIFSMHINNMPSLFNVSKLKIQFWIWKSLNNLKHNLTNASNSHDRFNTRRVVSWNEKRKVIYFQLSSTNFKT